MESVTVKARDGLKLDARLFTPADVASNLAVVLVHPFTVLAGLQPLLMEIAAGLAARGYRAVTFDRRGAGSSTGQASIRGIVDVIEVCRWVSRTFSPDGIVLIGYSTGAPMAGAAADRIRRVLGFVSLGFPFGIRAPKKLFPQAILRSKKPRLFIMGREDEFTSIEVFQNRMESASGRVESHLLEGLGHFQLIAPDHHALMVDLIANFIQTLQE